MTSFDAFEISREGSRPVELYVFAVGSTSYRYTSAEDSITIGVNVYTPIAIARSVLTQGAQERKRSVTLTLPGDNAFARRYVNVVPGERATVSILRLQRSETPTFNTQVLIYKGSIQSVRFPDDGATAEVTARSLEAAANKSIPRWTYMGMCNHILYDATSGCNANPDDPQFKVTASISAITGSVITVPGANTKPDGWWSGGYVRPVAFADFRVILGHVGNDLTLLLPFTGSLLGASVTIQAGCNHILTGDCGAKFNRSIDFGGFAFVPNKDIFKTGVV